MATCANSTRLLCTASSFALLSAVGAGQEKITRMSVDSGGAESNGASGSYTTSSISADGRYVAFDSFASNLVASDQNGLLDVFVHDRLTGETVRVSVDLNGADANGDSLAPSLSADGRFVAFSSDASDLVSFDANSTASDVFVRDRDPDGNGIFDEGNGVTTLESVDSNGSQVLKPSTHPSISGDGSRVAFECAGKLVTSDTNRAQDIFVRDRAAGQTIRASVDSSGAQSNSDSHGAAISRDGSVVAFWSYATNLVSGDTNATPDVFTHDLASGVTSRVDVDSSGGQANNGSNRTPAISSDGTVVAFSSYATNLVTGDTNGVVDVFVHDQTSGATERVSVDSAGGQADHDSLGPSLSDDGNVVAFYGSATNLVSGDGNGASDVFVRERASATTTASSISCVGLFGDWDSLDPALSADGTQVAFASLATNLADDDANGVEDVLVDDRTAPVVHATWSNYGSGLAGTLGIPSLTSSADPAFGSTLSIDLGNSLGGWTVALVFAGFGRASIQTRAGGTLLVDSLLTIAVGVPPFGAQLPASIPYDLDLCGLSFDVQAIELDPGAPSGLSFTAGLELVFGR